MNRLFILGLILVSVSSNRSTKISEMLSHRLTFNIEGKKLTMKQFDETSECGKLSRTVGLIPETMRAYIPKGYSIINMSSGDANLDKIKDIIIILKNNLKERKADFRDDLVVDRPFLLFLGNSDDTFTLEIKNDKVVYCRVCAGEHGDPFTGTAIEKGTILIKHNYSHSSLHIWKKETLFKYDLLRSNWFLFQDRHVTYKVRKNSQKKKKTLEIEDDSIERYKDFGDIRLQDYDIYAEEN